MQLGVAKEDIILVRGWIKTSGWAVAAFIEKGQSHEITFNGQFGSLAQAGFSLAMTESTMMSVETRYGPCRRTELSKSLQSSSTAGMELDTERDSRVQCVFLLFYKVKDRYILPKKIIASASPHDLPEDDEALAGTSSVDIVSEHTPSEVSFRKLLWIK